MPVDFLKDRLTAAAPRPDDDAELPEAGAPYQAHGRAANKPLYTLHCLLGAGGVRSFQYAHLDSGSTFTTGPGGQAITLLFAGYRPIRVVIRGRNLWRLYDALHQHRVPWVMRADRDFPTGPPDDPFVAAVEIDDESGGFRG